MLRSAILVWVLCCCTMTLRVDPTETELGGRQVSIQVVSAQDLSPLTTVMLSPTVVSAPAQVTANANIYALLLANGIVPDPEAFTIVYDLNLNIVDVKVLTPGTSVELPKVR